MTTAVLDASAALAWLVKTQETATSRAMLPHISEFDFIAPSVFGWEVHNVLLATGRTSPTAYQELASQLAAFNVELEPPQQAFGVIETAAETGLSLFDAAYFQLALQRGAPLMSRDGKLVRAAMANALVVYDLR